jgi:class 3 adenylate cyclase/tetratricopeptide (TPR) repeat protein
MGEQTNHDLLRPYVPATLLQWTSGTRHEERIGTLVSADISGFTALSERLASKGREGAEELTTVINDCFTGMIDDCNLHGGDVLKFGGDALLVLFDGPQHAERACRAAIAMRRTIRRPRRTSDGKRVQLAVSIGANSGAFDLFVVGGGHDELLVSGAGSTATVNAEAAANAGQILLTTAMAAELPATWLGETTSDGVLLRRSFGSSTPTAREEAVRTPVEFVHPEQAAQILANASNEHRQVSVAFVEFAHTDAMPRADLADKLQALATIIDEACARFGVHWLSTDVYPDGGKFILTAGAPLSRGGDEDRMLRAIRDVIDADPGLNLRAGVNRGYVFAGDLGSLSRRTYTIMGDAVNLAARLMAKAGPGEIVASRPIVDWASSEIEYEPLEPFMVKGKSMPIVAGRLGRILGRRIDLDRSDTELCGRTDEIELLFDRAAAAREGRGSMSVITGEPGIGKSRLALEVVRRHPDMLLGFARCQPYDRLAPYAVAEPLLRMAFGIDALADAADAGRQLVQLIAEVFPEAVPLAALVASAIGADVAATDESLAVVAEFRRTRTLQLVITLIQRTVTAPTVLFVDDVHLADDQSREILEALGEAVDETALLVLVTSVPGETLQPQPIELGPLGESDVSRLLEVLLGERAVAADVVRDVTARSSGNPLFLGELVRVLAEDPTARMPDSLEALVSSRVDALEPADRLLLRQASVMGVEVDIELLGRATSDDLIRRQDRWERLSRFLEWSSPGVVRFRYDTYWRVVYGGLSFAARRSAHARVISLLEADIAAEAGVTTDELAIADPFVIGRLAAHAERANDQPRIWKYANAAAVDAAERSLFGAASQLYEVALTARAAATRTELVEVAERAVAVFDKAGSFDAANRALMIALPLQQSAAGRAHLLRLRGEIAERRGDIALATRCFKQARAIWRDDDFGAGLDEQTRLNAAEAGLAYRQARYADSWALASSALTQANLIHEPGVAAHAGLLLNTLAFHMRLRGHQVRGPDLSELYRRAGDLVGEAHHLNNMAVDLYFEGDWATAATLYRQAAELCVTTGDVVYEATALNNIAEILSDQGRLDDAGTMFREAARTWRSVGFATGIALVEANLGRLATRSGDFDTADGLLASSLERFERLGAQAFVHEVELRIIDNDLMAGRRVERERLDEHARLARETDWDANLAAYAERLVWAVEMAAGDSVAAQGAIDRSIAVARRAGLEFDLALALLARAGTADVGAADDVDEAERLLARLGADAVVARQRITPKDRRVSAG